MLIPNEVVFFRHGFYLFVSIATDVVIFRDIRYLATYLSLFLTAVVRTIGI